MRSQRSNLLQLPHLVQLLHLQPQALQVQLRPRQLRLRQRQQQPQRSRQRLSFLARQPVLALADQQHYHGVLIVRQRLLLAVLQPAVHLRVAKQQAAVKVYHLRLQRHLLLRVQTAAVVAVQKRLR